MSVENVEKLFELVKNDENIAKQLIKIKDKLQQKDKIFDESQFVNDEIIPLAQKNGIDFTPEEFLNYVRAQISELSDEDLLNVSGGGSFQNFLLGGLLVALSSVAPAVGISSFKLVEPIAMETTTQNSETSSQTNQGGSDGAEASAKTKTDSQKDKSSEKKAASRKKSSKKANKNVATSRAQRNSSSRPGLSSRRGATQNGSVASAGLQSDAENLNQPQFSTPTEVSSEHSVPTGSEISQNNSVKSFTSEPKNEPTPNIKTDVVTPAPAPVVNLINKAEPTPTPPPVVNPVNNNVEPAPEPLPTPLVNPINNNKTTPEPAPAPLPAPQPNIKPEPTPQPNIKPEPTPQPKPDPAPQTVVVNPELDEVSAKLVKEKTTALAKYLSDNFDLDSFSNVLPLDPIMETHFEDFVNNIQFIKGNIYLHNVKIDNEDARIICDYAKKKYSYHLHLDAVDMNSELLKCTNINEDVNSFLENAESFGLDKEKSIESLYTGLKKMELNGELENFPQFAQESAKSFIVEIETKFAQKSESPTWKRCVKYALTAAITGAVVYVLGDTLYNNGGAEWLEVNFPTIYNFASSLFGKVPWGQIYGYVCDFVKSLLPSNNGAIPKVDYSNTTPLSNASNFSNIKNIPNMLRNTTNAVNSMLLKNPGETGEFVESTFTFTPQTEEDLDLLRQTLQQDTFSNFLHQAQAKGGEFLASAKNLLYRIIGDAPTFAKNVTDINGMLSANLEALGEGTQFAANTLTQQGASGAINLASKTGKEALNSLVEIGKNSFEAGGPISVAKEVVDNPLAFNYDPLNMINEAWNAVGSLGSQALDSDVINLATTTGKEALNSLVEINKNSLEANGQLNMPGSSLASSIKNFLIDNKISAVAIAGVFVLGGVLYWGYNHFKGASAQAQAPDAKPGGPPLGAGDAGTAAQPQGGADENSEDQPPALVGNADNGEKLDGQPENNNNAEVNDENEKPAARNLHDGTGREEEDSKGHSSSDSDDNDDNSGKPTKPGIAASKVNTKNDDDDSASEKSTTESQKQEDKSKNDPKLQALRIKTEKEQNAADKKRDKEKRKKREQKRNINRRKDEGKEEKGNTPKVHIINGDANSKKADEVKKQEPKEPEAKELITAPFVSNGKENLKKEPEGVISIASVADVEISKESSENEIDKDSDTPAEQTENHVPIIEKAINAEVKAESSDSEKNKDDSVAKETKEGNNDNVLSGSEEKETDQVSSSSDAENKKTDSGDTASFDSEKEENEKSSDKSNNGFTITNNSEEMSVNEVPDFGSSESEREEVYTISEDPDVNDKKNIAKNAKNVSYKITGNEKSSDLSNLNFDNGFSASDFDAYSEDESAKVDGAETKRNFFRDAAPGVSKNVMLDNATDQSDNERDENKTEEKQSKEDERNKTKSLENKGIAKLLFQKNNEEDPFGSVDDFIDLSDLMEKAEINGEEETRNLEYGDSNSKEENDNPKDITVENKADKTKKDDNKQPVNETDESITPKKSDEQTDTKIETASNDSDVEKSVQANENNIKGYTKQDESQWTEKLVTDSTSDSNNYPHTPRINAFLGKFTKENPELNVEKQPRTENLKTDSTSPAKNLVSFLSNFAKTSANWLDDSTPNSGKNQSNLDTTNKTSPFTINVPSPRKENEEKLVKKTSSDNEKALDSAESSQNPAQVPTENEKPQSKIQAESATSNKDEQTSNNNSKKDDDNMEKPGDITEEEDNQSTSKWTSKRVQDLYNNLGSFNGENKLPPELRQELYDFFDDVEVVPDAQEMTFKVGNVSIKGDVAQRFHDWAPFSNVVYNPNASDHMKELSRYVMFSGGYIAGKMENYSNKYGKCKENVEKAKENIRAFANDLKTAMQSSELNDLPNWLQTNFKDCYRYFNEYISKGLESNLNMFAQRTFRLKWTQEKVDELVNAVSSDNSESDLLNEWTLINFLKNIDVDYENGSGLAFKLHVNNSNEIINITGEQAQTLRENISKHVRIWFNPIFVRDSEKISKENEIEISEEEKIKLALKCVVFNNGYRDLHLATQYGELKFIKSENSKDSAKKNLLEAEKILEGLSSKPVWKKIQPWAKKMVADFTWSQARVNNVFTLIEKEINGINSFKVIQKEQKEISQFVNNLVILGKSEKPKFAIGVKNISAEQAQTIIDLKGKVNLDIIFNPYAKDKEMEALRCTTLSPDFLSMQANLANHFRDNNKKVNEVLVDFLDTLINVQNKNTISKYKSWVQDSFNKYIESIKKYFNVENLETAKEKLIA